MCKPKNLGGKRCNSHLTSQKVAVETQIQEKVLASLPEVERRNLENKVEEFEKASAQSKEPKNKVERIDAVAVRQKMLNDSSYAKAYAEFQNARNDYAHYNNVMDRMKNPTEQDRREFVALTNPKYARNAEKIRILTDKHLDNNATVGEVAKLNKLSQVQTKLIDDAPEKLSQSEIDEMILNNPHMERAGKSALIAGKVHEELAPHYRKEMVLARSTAYNVALKKFNKTEEGVKLTNKLAELTAIQNSDDLHIKTLGERCNRASDSGNELAKEKLVGELAQRKEFNRGSEYVNKFDYVKSSISKGKLDTEKAVHLPRFVRFDESDPNFTIKPQNEYDNTVNKLMKMNKIDPATASPETVSKIKSKIFARWGVTSMQEIASNKEVRNELEQNARLFSSNRNQIIDQEKDQLNHRQSRDLAKSKSETIQERFGF